MRKTVRRLALAIAGGLTFAMVSVGLPVSASATTVYDSAYTSLDELKVGQDHFYNSQTCAMSEDLRYTWDDYILDPAAQLVTGQNSQYATLRTSFANALASGSYAVSVNYNATATTGQFMQTIVVYWTEDGDAELDWVDYYSRSTPS